MIRTLAFVSLLALAAVAWGVRERWGSEFDFAALEEQSASDYRLRLVELTLAARRAPRSDRFLDHPSGAPVPWPPFFHAALALAARASLAREDGDRALAGVDEGRLERLAAHAGPVLGAAAALAAGLAVLAFHRGARSRAAALAAVLAYTFLPTLAAREAAGRLDAHAWSSILVFAQLALGAWMLRARLFSDLALAAMLAGFAGGIALLSAPQAALAVPILLSALLVGGRLARERAPRDTWRAALLYAAVAAAIATLSEPGPAAWRLLPEPRQGSRSFVGGVGVVEVMSSAWLALALFPIAWLVLAPSWRRPERLLLLAFGAAALAFALCDVRFASAFHASAVLTLALALVETLGRPEGSPRLRARLLRLAFLLALPLAAAPLLSPAGDPPSAARRSAWIEGLRWIRAQTPSAGPFNHANAGGEWSIVSSPAAAGSIVLHARRPVAAASFGSRIQSGLPRRILEVLAVPAPDALVRTMRELDASLLVVSPLFLRDPSFERVLRSAGRPESETVLARLALAAADARRDASNELVLLYASAERCTPEGRDDAQPSGPVISIYALAEREAEDSDAALRSR